MHTFIPCLFWLCCLLSKPLRTTTCNMKILKLDKDPWVWESVSCSVMSDSLQPHGLQPAMLLCPWNSSGKNTGVDSHSLLQGIFLTQGWNPALPHCGHILHHLSHQVCSSSASENPILWTVHKMKHRQTSHRYIQDRKQKVGEEKLEKLFILPAGWILTDFYDYLLKVIISYRKFIIIINA